MLSSFLFDVNVFSREVIELGWFGNLLIIINTIIMITLIVFYTHQHLYAIIGLITKPKTFKKAKQNHCYAYMISARNEALVIGNLIDSIYKQNYPKELMHVFVVADNCTDDTARVAKEHGAIVYERFNDVQKGKSYALDFLIKKILKHHQELNIEAYFVFDADNLLSENYTYEMNKAFDSGVKVCTSFRDSKNYEQNWISAGSAISFYRECLLVHHSRTILNMGTYVSGTGFYVDGKIIEKLGGWKYNTMVEDIEFSINCAIDDVKVLYCEKAIFYDEQPSTLKDSLNQRLRWCKGTHQCFSNYEGKLIKKLITRFKITCLDLIIHITPFPLLAFSWLVIYIICMGLNCLILGLPVSFFVETAIKNSYSLFLITFVVAFIHAIIVTYKMRNINKTSPLKQLWYCLLFPIFMFFYIPLSFIALFKKVQWTKIPHTYNKSIDNIIQDNTRK